MAEIRLLSPDELAAREQKPPRQRGGRRRSPERSHIIDAYKAVLQGALPGSGGDVLLVAGEDKRRVRKDLKEAASELTLALDFRPTKNPTRIHFRVISIEAYAARPRPRRT